MEGLKEGLKTLIPSSPCPEPLLALIAPRYVNVTFLVLAPQCNDATMIEFAILRKVHYYDVATTGRSTGRGSTKAKISYAVPTLWRHG
jgi:hypothetical protein